MYIQSDKPQEGKVKIVVSQSMVWCPSDMGWFKVNTDGGSCGNPKIALARGVIWGTNACVLACFSSFLGTFTSFEVEQLVT